jgi:hypothetical protein
VHRGYIKLWRVSLEKPIFQNPNLWQFATWCLMKATHKKIIHMVGYQSVELNPGQFVYGRNKASKELRSTPRKMRTCVSTLKKLDFLTIKTTNKFSVITVVNWDIYQPDEEKTTNKVTNKRPTNDQQTTTNKNNNNIKNNGDYPFRYKKKVPLPKNFHTTPDMIAYAKEIGYLGIPDEHTKTMILSSKAKDYKYKDWHAAWKTWLRNAIAKNPKLKKKEKKWADV